MTYILLCFNCSQQLFMMRGPLTWALDYSFLPSILETVEKCLLHFLMGVGKVLRKYR